MKQKIVFVFILIMGVFGVQDSAYASLGKIIDIKAGYYHNIALTEDGEVWGWGGNQGGQLGDGEEQVIRDYPVQVNGLNDIIAIGAGDLHSAAVKNDGTVWSWGRNSHGELGDGTLDNRLMPVQVTGLNGVIDVSCGYYFTVALKNDGTVWAWGDNEKGQLGIGSTASKAAPVKVAGISDVISIRAGWDHVLALKSNGELWSWGNNTTGQCGDGTETRRLKPVKIMSDVVLIGAGGGHSFAIKNDGTLWAWGLNASGELGVGTRGDVRTSPVQVVNMSNVKYITAGFTHTVLLKHDGTVWVCGSDIFGELGDGIIYDGTENEKTTFIQLYGISGAKAVAAGGNRYTLALLQSGSVWGCGLNSCGVLGN